MSITSQQIGPQQNTTEWINDLKNKAKKGWESFSSLFNTPTTVTTTTGATGTTGGKRTKRRKIKGGTTLATNAAPVHGLAVAKPTYWIKGGKRTRRKSKKNRSRRNRK
jgi:hypothetical protein